MLGVAAVAVWAAGLTGRGAPAGPQTLLAGSAGAAEPADPVPANGSTAAAGAAGTAAAPAVTLRPVDVPPAADGSPPDTSLAPATAQPPDRAAPPSTAAPTTTTTTAVAPSTTVPPATTEPPDPLEGRVVRLHGDALVLDAERELRAVLAPARLLIDAEPGRTLAEAVPSILAIEPGPLDIVVLALGGHDHDAGAGYPQLVAGMVDRLAGAGCLVWVDAQETGEGHAAVNAAIAAAMGDAANGVLVRWSAVAGRPGLHADDGHRLAPTGTAAYSTLVGEGVRLCLEPPPGSTG